MVSPVPCRSLLPWEEGMAEAAPPAEEEPAADAEARAAEEAVREAFSGTDGEELLAILLACCPACSGAGALSA